MDGLIMPTDERIFRNAKTAGDAAAMWWSSVLRDPKIDSGDDNPKRDNLIALRKEKLLPQPIGGLEAFAGILAQRLNQYLAEYDPDDYTTRYGITLRVDYRPDMFLSECAEQAGLRNDITDWPWKTVMWVKPDKVSVKYGDRAKTQVIWTKQS